MNRINSLCLLFAVIFMLGMSSCTKEKGCTDPTSPSFNVDAKKDDGSCVVMADALIGNTWTALETVNSDEPTQYSVNITKVQDDTILITPILQFPDELTVEVSWPDKSIEGYFNGVGSNLITGEIKSLNELNLTYYRTSFGISDTVMVKYTR